MGRQLRERCAVHGISECDPFCTGKLHGVYISEEDDHPPPPVDSQGVPLPDADAAQQFQRAAEELNRENENADSVPKKRR